MATHKQGLTPKTKYDIYPSLRLFDALNIHYIVVADTKDMPLWTGFAMMLDAHDNYEDAGFFHELCHWLVATPSQRRRPDFGLGRQPNAYGTRPFAFTTSTMNGIAGPRVMQLEEIVGRGWGERCVSEKTADNQEQFASDALVLYEALIGAAAWDNPPVREQMNTAFYDLASPEHRPLPNIDRMYDTVIVALHAALGRKPPSRDVVKSYVRTVWQRASVVD